MNTKPLKIAVLASTKATDLQRIIDEINAGNLNAKIEVLISDKKDAYAYSDKELEKINRVSMEASVTIKEFGNRLKNVYLTAPEEEVKKAIEENYRDFLSPTLLNLWLEDPSKALGRVTSSPWPERIEFIGVFLLSNDDQYIALGRIIEVTSVEMIEGGEASSQIAKFTIKKINGKWLIDNIEIENNE